MPRPQICDALPEIESRVIALVADLVAEIRSTTSVGAEVARRRSRDACEVTEVGRGAEAGDLSVSVDSRLEEDLGLFSLEQLELLHRVEQAFDVPLSIDALGDIQDVGDLAAVVQGAARRDSRRASVAAVSAGPRERPPAGSPVYSIYVGLLILPFIAVLWLLLHVVPRGPTVCTLLRIGARWFVRAAGLGLQVHGTAHLRGIEPAVLVSNHQSYIDSIVLLAALPIDVIIIANEKLRRSPLPALVLRTASYVVVDRESKRSRLEALPSMVAALHRGESLLVFPEATFDHRRELLPFRLGAFAAAAEAARPVVPIAVRGTRDVLPSGRRLLSRGKIAITIGPPMHSQGTGWTETLRLRNNAKEWIEQTELSG